MIRIISILFLLLIFFSCNHNEKGGETINSGIAKENWDQIQLISDKKRIYILHDMDSAIFYPNMFEEYIDSTRKKIFISKQERDSVFDWCAVYLNEPPPELGIQPSHGSRPENIYACVWGRTKVSFYYETEKASQKIMKNFMRIKALTFERVK